MRLIEELLSQADKALKVTIELNVELFVQIVKKSSSIKGIRWDDIVFKLEYQANVKPKLVSFI